MVRRSPRHTDSSRGSSPPQDCELGYAAALTALLARLGERDDVVIGTPVSRRAEASSMGLLGCLTDTLPLRLKNERSFENLVIATRAAVRAPSSHRSVPGTRLMREFGQGGDRSRFPLFQVVLTVDDADSSGLDLPGVEATRMYAHAGTAKYDAFVHLIPQADGLRGFFEYNTELFDPRTARRIAERFRVLLADAIARPDVPLAELNVMSARESALVDDWSTGDAAGLGESAVDPVIATARERPGRTAIVHGGRTVDYAELDAYSERIARALVANGHRRAAIMTEGSCELLMAVLGAIRAGACVVPLDPAYPAARLSFMLRDSGATALLTTGESGSALVTTGVPG